MARFPPHFSLNYPDEIMRTLREVKRCFFITAIFLNPKTRDAGLRIYAIPGQVSRVISKRFSRAQTSGHPT